VFDACLRAANVLEYCRDVPSLAVSTALRILDAATAAVLHLRRIRDERRERTGLEDGIEIVQAYSGGRWTPHTFPLETAFQKPSASMSIEAVIDRLLRLADSLRYIGWLSGDQRL